MKYRADEVLTTKEACHHLKISRPTFLKLVNTNQVGAKGGKRLEAPAV